MLDLKAGDRGAFDRIVEKYSGPIINYIYRFTGSKEDAQDLAQDVFIRIYNAAPSYTPSAKFTTWIYRIASNISIDHLRKRRSSGNPQSLDETVQTQNGVIENQVPDERSAPPDKLAENSEARDNIRRALLKLPENQRTAIILKIYEDRSYADIAAILGVSTPSVESLIFRARTALRIYLK